MISAAFFSKQTNVTCTSAGFELVKLITIKQLLNQKMKTVTVLKTDVYVRVKWVRACEDKVITARAVDESHQQKTFQLILHDILMKDKVTKA